MRLFELGEFFHHGSDFFLDGADAVADLLCELVGGGGCVLGFGSHCANVYPGVGFFNPPTRVFFVIVFLNWFEFSVASHVGQLRQVESIRQGLKNGGSFGGVDEAEAAAAEMAVAKATGQYWDGSVNNFDLPDIGEYHVRHTKRNDGCLILRKRDITKFGEDAVYVLVTGSRGEYVVQGKITAREAQKEDFWRNPNGRGGAWFVPQTELTPI